MWIWLRTSLPDSSILNNFKNYKGEVSWQEELDEAEAHLHRMFKESPEGKRIIEAERRLFDQLTPVQEYDQLTPVQEAEMMARERAHAKYLSDARNYLKNIAASN
jgi:hypothetical protein